MRRADHVVRPLRRRRLPRGGLGRDAAPRPGGGRGGDAAHAPDRARRRARAVRLSLRAGARPVPDAARPCRPSARRSRWPCSPAGPPRELLGALAAGDAARFQAVPGIGKRTAERIIVELREKVGGGTAAPSDGAIVAAAARAASRARSRAKGCSSSATRRGRPRSCCASADGESAEELIAQALRAGADAGERAR